MWAESPDFEVCKRCKMMEEHSAEVAVRQNLLDRLLDAVKQVRRTEGGYEWLMRSDWLPV